MPSPSIAVHAVFEAQAAATPDAPAVLFESSVVTYRELNEQANRLAHRLMRLGVARGSLVCLCMDRSPHLVVALLGILKAGGAYVPLDPAYPDNRLALVLADTAAPVVLAQPSTAARLAALADRVRILCPELDGLASEPATNPDCGVTGQDVVYVMYTSGSTGMPKGVLVRHRGVVRLVRGADYCNFGPDEVFLLHSPLTFDASTFEIWGPLLNGGRLAVLPSGVAGPWRSRRGDPPPRRHDPLADGRVVSPDGRADSRGLGSRWSAHRRRRCAFPATRPEGPAGPRPRHSRQRVRPDRDDHIRLLLPHDRGLPTGGHDPDRATHPGHVGSHSRRANAARPGGRLWRTVHRRRRRGGRLPQSARADPRAIRPRPVRRPRRLPLPHRRPRPHGAGRHPRVSRAARRPGQGGGAPDRA